MTARDLGDRGCTDRLFVKVREKRFQRGAEGQLDGRLDRREWLGRKRILELQKIGGRFLAYEIGARSERLAQLDRGRANCLERGGIIGNVGLARSEAGDAH